MDRNSSGAKRASVQTLRSIAHTLCVYFTSSGSNMNIKSNNAESNVHGLNAASVPSAAANGALSREFNSFITDIEELIKATTSLTGEDLARAKAKLNARVTKAKESVEELSGIIAERARSTAKITDSYVHEQPWQAIGIGAALGLLIGFALAPRA
jgi:ElaB/YqjD/DUF883 family membrane-anchored ribosome-binding protein